MSSSGIQTHGQQTAGSIEPRLERLMADARRRLWLLDAARGACWGLLAALVTVLIGMWVDLIWELPPQIRLDTWILAIVALSGALGRILWLTWGAVEARRMARRIDTAVGSHGELLNGFEFSEIQQQQNDAARQPASRNNPLTAGLTEMAVARAGQLADQVQPSSIISHRPALFAVQVLAAVFVVLGLFSVVCPVVATTQWQRFISPFSDTPPYSPYQIKVEPGDTDVVYGKGLEIRVKVTGPVARSVALVLMTQGQTETVPLFPEPNGIWRTHLSRLTEETFYQAQVERARSSKYRIHIVTTPAIEDVKFVVTPPVYTHDPAYTGPLPKSGLVGLAGTAVRVTAKSNRPLSSGELRLISNDEVETVRMSPAQPGESLVTGEFFIARSAKFEIRLTDRDGQVSQDPFVGSITLLNDERPLIRILEPKPRSLATPTTLLPVALDAEDDFGISRVELYRSLNDSRPLSTPLPLPEPPPRRFRDQQYLPLARYHLEPGDEIKLFARVLDNDPSGAKGSESTIAVIQIISQAEFERMLRMREGMEVLLSKYQQAERRLEALAEELARLQKDLEQADPDSPLSEQLRERIEQLANEMNEEAEAIARAAEHDLPYDIDKKLKNKLMEQAEKLKERSDELKQLVKRDKNPSDMNNEAVRRQLAKMAQELSEQRKELATEATEPLEHLAKVYPLMEDQARYTALVLWQTDLAERLASFKGIERSDDPAAKARLRELQEEQRRVRQELQKLLEDIENHVKQLPDDEKFDTLRESATKFAEAVNRSGANEEMVAGETELTDFRGDAGYRHAQEAAEILKQFLGKCRSMGGEGQACLKFCPGLSDALGDTIDQLLEEAGLLPGGSSGKGMSQGRGAGGRGGNGTRSGNRNVGLYGGMDVFGGKANSGQGQGASAGSLAAGKNEWKSDAADSSSVAAPWKRSASAEISGPLPPQYRRRVSQYFQRVASELEAADK